LIFVSLSFPGTSLVKHWAAVRRIKLSSEKVLFSTVMLKDSDV
jgi:hypothetical protein